MNIALCHESVVPAKGGCETYIADLVRHLVSDRHQVHLYASAFDSETLPAEAVFHEMPRFRVPRFLRPWRFAEACENALAHEKHDVVVGFVKTWRQDVIIPQGGLHVASAEFNLRKYTHPFVRAVARWSKWIDPCSWSYARLERKQFQGDYRPFVVAPSNMVRKHFRHYYGIQGDRIRVIPNAIDPNRLFARNRLLLRDELRLRLGIAPTESAGLFIGHNYRLKGLDTLLLAVREVPAWAAFKLIVCGSPNIGRYRRLVRKLGIADRVHLLGFQPDVRPAFYAADFLVHPTYYDPCSLVVLEALTCGLPVVTTRCNGAAELLHPPEDGFVVDDPRDYHGLAIRIELLCDRSRQHLRAQAARKTAAAWTFEEHYKALLAVLEESAIRKQLAA